MLLFTNSFLQNYKSKLQKKASEKPTERLRIKAWNWIEPTNSEMEQTLKVHRF